MATAGAEGAPPTASLSLHTTDSLASQCGGSRLSELARRLERPTRGPLFRAFASELACSGSGAWRGAERRSLVRELISRLGNARPFGGSVK